MNDLARIERARRVAEYLRGSLAMHKVSEIAVEGQSAAFSVEADDGVTRSSVRITVDDTTDAAGLVKGGGA